MRSPFCALPLPFHISAYPRARLSERNIFLIAVVHIDGIWMYFPSLEFSSLPELAVRLYDGQMKLNVSLREELSSFVKNEWDPYSANYGSIPHPEYQTCRRASFSSCVTGVAYLVMSWVMRGALGSTLTKAELRISPRGLKYLAEVCILIRISEFNCRSLNGRTIMSR